MHCKVHILIESTKYPPGKNNTRQEATPEHSLWDSLLLFS